MKSILSQNIKRLRKEKKLTQEQLAKAVNVTTGAVYKWEQELSTPDLNTIMDLARFFSLSVDSLIGYDAINHNLDEDIILLKKYVNEAKYDEALNMADRMLILYPNNFDILYNCGLLYEHYVYERLQEDDAIRDEYIDKALELFYKAKSLINDTSSPTLYAYHIDSYISECYNEKKEYNKAIEILQNINFEGINNSRIAEILVLSGSKDESKIKKYLSDSFLYSSNSLLNSILLIVYYCDINKDKNNLRIILDFAINYINLMHPESECGYMDKSLGFLYFRKAVLLNEFNEEYHHLLKKSYEAVKKYDSACSHTNNDVAITFLNDDSRRVMDNGGLSSLCLINDYIETNELNEDFLSEWKKIINN